MFPDDYDPNRPIHESVQDPQVPCLTDPPETVEITHEYGGLTEREEIGTYDSRRAGEMFEIAIFGGPDNPLDRRYDPNRTGRPRE